MTDKAELLFLPLGGCNEIGMNLNAYAYGPMHDRRWIIVDMGVSFGDLRTPGVDVIIPDPGFIEEQRDNIEAIFLTHAHEDHIGAVGHLWHRFQKPMYATPFTAELIRHKLNDAGVIDKAKLNVVPLGGKVKAGPFEVEYVTLTHSIPEPNGLAIKTPAGTILHTGDWKIDPDPQIGAPFDSTVLEKMGDDGVLAMVCDSTNVFEEGEAGSEGSCRDELVDLIGEQTGRVAVTAFASNVARVESIVRAAEANGRHVCLVGRSMHRITAAAKAVGMLADCAEFVDEKEAGYLPPEAILYLCTGSQGEPRAALSRIAQGNHPHVTLNKGDTVIFSSRVIPGNERGIFDLQNALAEKGVKLITDRMRHIHVSGHPCRDELRRMYSWVRPRISVPVHGERRHILEHADYAKSLQVSEAVTPKNGDVIRLAPGRAKIVDEVPTGRLLLDGKRLIPENAQGIQERRRLSFAGHVTVAICFDDNADIIDGPEVFVRGYSEPDGRTLDETIDAFDEAAENAIDSLKRKARLDDETVERSLIRALRKVGERELGKRPLIDVSILRG
ncbi:ribonuclease J [Ponticaulis sp.]|uniref:ribonuclease J n=1 Tax=Ponticaulis sp. TaxID=2020902 RepID=UPI000C4F43E9|nr:ribonuclease J [Ponticaulis sp.]MAF56383.1 MBL fold metallo-hydrolase [Ponticaulis sp.]MBN04678.1 MBL fold metallo-hydrolase [Ponticaulis sp.]